MCAFPVDMGGGGVRAMPVPVAAPRHQPNGGGPQPGAGSDAADRAAELQRQLEALLARLREAQRQAEAARKRALEAQRRAQEAQKRAEAAEAQAERTQKLADQNAARRERQQYQLEDAKFKKESAAAELHEKDAELLQAKVDQKREQKSDGKSSAEADRKVEQAQARFDEAKETSALSDQYEQWQQAETKAVQAEAAAPGKAPAADAPSTTELRTQADALRDKFKDAVGAEVQQELFAGDAPKGGSTAAGSPLDQLLQVAPFPKQAEGQGTPVQRTLAAIAEGSSVAQVARDRGISQAELVAEARRAGIEITSEEAGGGEVQITRLKQGSTEVTYSHDLQHDVVSVEGSYADAGAPGGRQKVSASEDGNGQIRQTGQDAKTGDTVTHVIDTRTGTRTDIVVGADGRRTETTTELLGAPVTHSVQAGESPLGIAKNAGLSPEQLVALNPRLLEGKPLQVGDELVLAGRHTTVKEFKADGSRVETTIESDGTKQVDLVAESGRRSTLEGEPQAKDENTKAVRKGLFEDGKTVAQVAKELGISEQRVLGSLDAGTVEEVAPTSDNGDVSTRRLYDPATNTMVIETYDHKNDAAQRRVIGPDQVFKVTVVDEKGKSSVQEVKGGLGYAYSIADQKREHAAGVGQRIRDLDQTIRLYNKMGEPTGDLYAQRKALVQQHDALKQQASVQQGKATQVQIAQQQAQADKLASDLYLAKTYGVPGSKEQKEAAALFDQVIGVVDQLDRLSVSAAKDVTLLEATRDLSAARTADAEAEAALEAEYQRWKEDVWTWGSVPEQQAKELKAEGKKPPGHGMYRNAQEEDEAARKAFLQSQEFLDESRGQQSTGGEFRHRDAWLARNTARDDLYRANVAFKEASGEKKAADQHLLQGQLDLLEQQKADWARAHPDDFEGAAPQQQAIDQTEKGIADLRIGQLLDAEDAKRNSHMLSLPADQRAYQSRREDAERDYANDNRERLAGVSHQVTVIENADASEDAQAAQAYKERWAKANPTLQKELDTLAGTHTTNPRMADALIEQREEILTGTKQGRQLDLALDTIENAKVQLAGQGAEDDKLIGGDLENIEKGIDRHSFIRDGWSAMFGDASDDAKEYTQEQRDALRSLRDDLENDRITVSEFADKRAALMGRYGQEAAEHAENIEDSDGTWAVVDEAVRTTAIVAAGIGTTLLTGGNLAAGIGASMAVATVWDVGNDVNAMRKGEDMNADGHSSVVSLGVKQAWKGGVTGKDVWSAIKDDTVDLASSAVTAGGVGAGMKASAAISARLGGRESLNLGQRALVGAGSGAVAQGADGAGRIGVEALRLGLDGKLGSDEANKHLGATAVNSAAGLLTAPFTGAMSGAIPLKFRAPATAPGAAPAAPQPSVRNLSAPGVAAQFVNDGVGNLGTMQLATYVNEGRGMNKGEVIAASVQGVSGTLTNIAMHPRMVLKERPVPDIRVGMTVRGRVNTYVPGVAQPTVGSVSAGLGTRTRWREILRGAGESITSLSTAPLKDALGTQASVAVRPDELRRLSAMQGGVHLVQRDTIFTVFSNKLMGVVRGDLFGDGTPGYGTLVRKARDLGPAADGSGRVVELTVSVDLQGRRVQLREGERDFFGRTADQSPDGQVKLKDSLMYDRVIEDYRFTPMPPALVKALGFIISPSVERRTQIMLKDAAGAGDVVPGNFFDQYAKVFRDAKYRVQVVVPEGQQSRLLGQADAATVKAMVADGSIDPDKTLVYIPRSGGNHHRTAIPGKPLTTTETDLTGKTMRVPAPDTSNVWVVFADNAPERAAMGALYRLKQAAYQRLPERFQYSRPSPHHVANIGNMIDALTGGRGRPYGNASGRYTAMVAPVWRALSRYSPVNFSMEFRVQLSTPAPSAAKAVRKGGYQDYQFGAGDGATAVKVPGWLPGLLERSLNGPTPILPKGGAGQLQQLFKTLEGAAGPAERSSLAAFRRQYLEGDTAPLRDTAHVRRPVAQALTSLLQGLRPAAAETQPGQAPALMPQRPAGLRRADLNYLGDGEVTINGRKVDPADIEVAVPPEMALVIADEANLPDAATIAQGLAARGYRPGQEVALLVCRAGDRADPDAPLPDSVALALSNQLGARVHAMRGEIALGQRVEFDDGGAVVERPHLPLTDVSANRSAAHADPNHAAQARYWLGDQGRGPQLDSPFNDTLRSRGAWVREEFVDPFNLGIEDRVVRLAPFDVRNAAEVLPQLTRQLAVSPDFNRLGAEGMARKWVLEMQAGKRIACVIYPAEGSALGNKPLGIIAIHKEPLIGDNYVRTLPSENYVGRKPAGELNGEGLRELGDVWQFSTYLVPDVTGKDSVFPQGAVNMAAKRQLMALALQQDPGIDAFYARVHAGAPEAVDVAGVLQPREPANGPSLGSQESMAGKGPLALVREDGSPLRSREFPEGRPQRDVAIFETPAQRFTEEGEGTQAYRQKISDRIDAQADPSRWIGVEEPPAPAPRHLQVEDRTVSLERFSLDNARDAIAGAAPGLREFSPEFNRLGADGMAAKWVREIEEGTRIAFVIYPPEGSALPRTPQGIIAIHKEALLGDGFIDTAPVEVYAGRKPAGRMSEAQLRALGDVWQFSTYLNPGKGSAFPGGVVNMAAKQDLMAQAAQMLAARGEPVPAFYARVHAGAPEAVSPVDGALHAPEKGNGPSLGSQETMAGRGPIALVRERGSPVKSEAFPDGRPERYVAIYETPAQRFARPEGDEPPGAGTLTYRQKILQKIEGNTDPAAWMRPLETRPEGLRTADLNYLRDGEVTVDGRPVSPQDVAVAAPADGFVVMADAARLPALDRLVADMRSAGYRPGQEVVLYVGHAGERAQGAGGWADATSLALANRLGARVHAVQGELALKGVAIAAKGPVADRPLLPVVEVPAHATLDPDLAMQQRYWLDPQHRGPQLSAPFGAASRVLGAWVDDGQVDPLSLGRQRPAPGGVLDLLDPRGSQGDSAARFLRGGDEGPRAT